MPLFLLVGFVALVGGTVVWLDLTYPEQTAVHTEGPHIALKDGSAVPGEKVRTPGDVPPGHGEGARPSPEKSDAGHGPVGETPATEKPAGATAGQGDPAPAASPDPAGHGTGSGSGSGSGHSPPVDAAHATGHETAGQPAAGAAPSGQAEGPSSPAGHTESPPSHAGSGGAGSESDSPPPAPPATPPQIASRPVEPERLPRVRPDPPLPVAPDPALVQESSVGPLPKVSDDGRQPWRVYAKPFDISDSRPRVAIVITGLGLSAAATESAIQGLPGSVTLAFAPYASKLNDWIRLARAGGHEVLLNVPMEPTNYPAYDPGPQTLLTSLNDQGNLDRLMWILSRGTGYVGVVDFMGSRFLGSREHLEPVLAALKERGLLFVDSGSAPRPATASVSQTVKLPWTPATLTLDGQASRVEIDRKFAELERIARRDKRAVAIGSPYPVTMERAATWARQLEARGIAVAPISALVGITRSETANQ